MQRYAEQHGTTNPANGMVSRISVVDAFGGERKVSPFGGQSNFGVGNTGGSLASTFGGGNNSFSGNVGGTSAFSTSSAFATNSSFGGQPQNSFGGFATSPFTR